MTHNLLIALGGNALILPGERGYIEEQFLHTDACMKPIVGLIRDGFRIVLTHGNGPIVGNILLRNECARDIIPPMPLYICVADSQGGIGAMMQQSLKNQLSKLGIERQVATVVTHVVVDRNDPDFENPTKPIGPYFKDAEARYLIEKRGFKMREIPGKGWRRLVPSPGPLKIVEIDSIKTMFLNGIIPIACGGGGIPVIEDNGSIKGVEAVVDKDLTASLMSRALPIDTFIILTDVEGVYLSYGRKDQQLLRTLGVEDSRKYLKAGEFPPGNMGPKIQAAIESLDSGGKEVIICRPEDVRKALDGEKGTRIRRI